MRMRGEEQLPENLFLPQTFLLRQAGARAMPPMSELGRALRAESDRSCIDERTAPGRSRSPSLPNSGKGLAGRHRLLRVPACGHVGSTPTEPQAPGMLDEPTARPGQCGSLPVPCGLDDSDQYDVVYGGLDHTVLALVALFREADD